MDGYRSRSLYNCYRIKSETLGSFSAEESMASMQQAWKIVATKVKYYAYLRHFWWVIHRSQRKILLQVNSVNISGVNRTTEQIEHKWWDLKSSAKKAVAKWKLEATKTGSGINPATPPTQTQLRVISVIGTQSVTVVDGASELETSDS